MTGIDVLDKILPLIGVLIGVFMSPWVIHRIEKGKRKDSLKYQLIESIYLMSKLVQVHSNSCNLYWFYHQRLEVMRVKIPTHSTIARDEIEVSKYNEKMHNSYDALSEIEAKIISMKVEVRDHYSHKKISQLNNLINQAILKSNTLNDFKLFDYSSLDLQQLEQVNLLFGKAKDEQARKLQEDADKLIDKVESLLS